MTELSPEARALLRKGRDAYATDAQVQAVREALRAKLGAQSPGVDAGAHAILSKSALKLVVAGVLALSAASVYVVVVVRRDAFAPPAIAQPARATAPLVATAPISSAREPTPSEAIEVARDAAASEPLPVPAGHVPARAPAGRRARASAAVDTPAVAVQGPATASTAAAAAPAVIADPDTLAQEVALIRASRAAYERNDYALALSIAQRHAARFPEGALREEQLAIAARAGCALGRGDAGRESIRRLAELAPDSPHLAELRRQCGPVR